MDKTELHPSIYGWSSHAHEKLILCFLCLLNMDACISKLCTHATKCMDWKAHKNLIMYLVMCQFN